MERARAGPERSLTCVELARQAFGSVCDSNSNPCAPPRLRAQHAVPLQRNRFGLSYDWARNFASGCQ
jgi:hypothetical protein